jgi:5-methyltetrahydropteroyltriglutamate--homocysteine methyltransferase
VIRASNHGDYPRFGDYPPDEQLRALLAARDTAGAAEIAAVADEVVGLVVAEQSRAFIDIVTDGSIRQDGPLSLLTDHLAGLTHGEPTTWLDGLPADRRPRCHGPIERTGPFLLHGYAVASDVAQTPVKTSLIGPVSFARSVDDAHYGDVAALARAVAAALAAEVRALAEAGATHFQLDEPTLCRRPEDLELVAETAGAVFGAAGPDATTVLSTYFGSLVPLAERLERLPGTHLGLDLVGNDDGFALLERLPAGRGVYLGLWDARAAEVEDAADVAARLAPHRERLQQRDVIVGPQAGMAGLSRDDAFDKLLQARYLVESLRREWDWD